MSNTAERSSRLEIEEREAALEVCGRPGRDAESSVKKKHMFDKEMQERLICSSLLKELR